MATQLFLRNTVEAGVAITGFDEYELNPSRGPSNVFHECTTTASGNHIIIQQTGVNAIYLYRVEAVTISGTVTFDMCGLESAMGVNAGFAALVSRYDSTGAFVSDVVAQGNANHADGVELGTGVGRMNWTATPTSTAFTAGDWLAVLIHADAVGTMGAGTVQLALDGTNAATADSSVTFTETVVEFTPPSLTAAQMAGMHQPEPPDLQIAEMRPRRFAFLDGLWRPDHRLALA